MSVFAVGIFLCVGAIGNIAGGDSTHALSSTGIAIQEINITVAAPTQPNAPSPPGTGYNSPIFTFPFIVPTILAGVAITGLIVFTTLRRKTFSRKYNRYKVRMTSFTIIAIIAVGIGITTLFGSTKLVGINPDDPIITIDPAVINKTFVQGEATTATVDFNTVISLSSDIRSFEMFAISDNTTNGISLALVGGDLASQESIPTANTSTAPIIIQNSSNNAQGNVIADYTLTIAVSDTVPVGEYAIFITYTAIAQSRLVEVPSCDDLIASGNMGGTSTWSICDGGIMIISGGTANNNTGNLNHNRVPEIYRPLVGRAVFADVVTVGNSSQDMFNGFANLTRIDNLSLLDTSTAVHMRSMFANTPNLVELDLTTFDTSNVANFHNMFLNSGITYLDVSGWNTSSATNVNSMFRDAQNLTALNTGSWTFAGTPDGTVNGVIDMARMFEGTHSLTTIGDVSGWVTSSVTRYYNMFLHARSLTSLPGINSWDTSSAIRMQSMFSNTWALTELDLSSWQINNVTDFSNTFRDNGLVRLNLSGWNPNNTVNMANMFANTVLRFALRELTLGSNWQQGLNNTNLMAPPNNTEFTGAWVNVGSGTIQNPEANFHFTTGNLLINTGPHSSGPHTWVWEPRNP